MKNLNPFILLTTILAIFSACGNSIDETKIIGNWTATAFIENNTPKEVDLNAINFSFYDNNTYTFQGLMNKEAGNYHIRRNLLYSTDTLSDNRIEKSVKIITLKSDSLFFEMNNGGITQIIKLHKTN